MTITKKITVGLAAVVFVLTTNSASAISVGGIFKALVGSSDDAARSAARSAEEAGRVTVTEGDEAAAEAIKETSKEQAKDYFFGSDKDTENNH
jgi:hypothetical protein